MRTHPLHRSLLVWCLALAMVLVPLALFARDVPVFSGGTKSREQRGYHDMAVPSNTDELRRSGGRIYIHPLGWEHTSEADRDVLRALYPDPPIYEHTAANDTKSPRQYYEQKLQKYWPRAFAVTMNRIAERPLAAMQFQKDQFKHITDTIAPVAAPNNPRKIPLDKYPWKHARWDQLRANAKLGGGLATDAPPDLYFKREEAYREWIADSLNWARSENLKAIVLIYPRQAEDFPEVARRYVADLKRRGVEPSAWAFNGYYAADNPAKYPMGDEDDPRSQGFAARWLAEQERREATSDPR